MANTKGSDNPFPSVLFAEHVDPSNPAAGFQRLFVDTDHLLKMVDSSGTVTTFGTGFADPMTTRGDLIIRNASNVTARLGRGSASQVLTSDGTDIAWATPSAGAGVAADTIWDVAGDIAIGTGADTADNVHRPELADNSTGTDVDMSGAATGTGVSTSSPGHGLRLVTFTDNSHQYWDVTRNLGTGDFDVRARIVSVVPTSVSGLAANFYGGLSITDSSRTASTRQILVIFGPGAAVSPYCRPITNASFVGTALYVNQFPIILRMARVGTTLTFYVSIDEGHSWCGLGTATTSTDFQKLGLNAHNNSGGSPQFAVDWVRQI